MREEQQAELVCVGVCVYICVLAEDTAEWKSHLAFYIGPEVRLIYPVGCTGLTENLIPQREGLGSSGSFAFPTGSLLPQGGRKEVAESHIPILSHS